VKVAELAENLAKRKESRRIVRLGDLAIPDDCSSITIPASEDTPAAQFLLDEKTLRVLAKFLKLPATYLEECPPDFRSTTLRYWRDRKGHVDVVLEAVDDNVTALYSPGLMMLPVARVARMIERTFKPEDDIRLLLRDEQVFHVDITSDDFKIEIPNPRRIPGRPEVGDITCGGIRFLASPSKVKAPSVSRFLHRLVCTNGMVTDAAEDKIVIKGLSVAEVIESMEEAADRLLSNMDEHLDRYKDTALLAVPGHPLSFAEQLGHEFNVPQRQLHAILDRVRQLPEEGATVFDVAQAFTSVANEVHNYADRTRLQTLGGSLALEAPRMIERCHTCQTLLVEHG
jgi:hypothetical protein